MNNLILGAVLALMITSGFVKSAYAASTVEEVIACVNPIMSPRNDKLGYTLDFNQATPECRVHFVNLADTDLSGVKDPAWYAAIVLTRNAQQNHPYFADYRAKQAYGFGTQVVLTTVMPDGTTERSTAFPE